MPTNNAAHSRLVNDVLLALSPLGVRLWKNHQGVAKYPNEARVPYGLCQPGGSDLIGFTPIGGRAIFTAIECKTGRAKPTGPQQQFIDAVIAAGGIAGVARSVDDAVNLVVRAARGQA